MRRLTILLFAVALTSGLGAPWAGATSSSTLLSLLVQKGEMAGFAINGTPTAGATPTSFVKNIYKVTGSTEKNDVATLVGEGFIGGASEFLRASDGLAASQVWEFKTATDANAFLESTFARAEAQLPKGSTVSALKVAVSGAHAFSAHSGRDIVSDNYISIGRCMLFVGDDVAGSAERADAPVVAASHKVEGRAGGVCA